MELDNSFDVPAPPERVWEFLLDLERVTPCMPGAELDELVDERTWKGSVTVKLGAVKLSYASTVVIEERDDAQRRVVMKASGREKRGKGMANATIHAGVGPADGVSRVTMKTDLTISGAVAQYGRGMIADVSKRLTDEFANCLKGQLAAGPPAVEARAAAPADPGPPPVESSGAPPATAPPTPPQPAPATPPPPQAKPIGGIRLALWAIARAIWRGIKRLFGRGGARDR
jgi:carbon monoxide dehydrogenase subunit G